MSLPKRKIEPRLGDKNIGTERVKELLHETDKKTQFLPRSIDFKDIDNAVNSFVKEDKLKFIYKNNIIPVIYLENDRWGEFSKTWKIMDGDKNVPTPYITVRRKEKEPYGTRLGKKYRIADPKAFTYQDVEILDEGQVISVRYKIPQPVDIDLSYEVRLFTKYRNQVNAMDSIVMRVFAGRQAYIIPKGNPMPILLESVDEPRNLGNIDGDRFYMSVYNLKVLGFIQESDEFEIVKTSRRPRLGYDLYNGA